MLALISAAAMAATQPTIDVMVLGAYHLDNPGRDINNVKADDPLTPKRQDELESLASALAKFRPTAIAVEREIDDPSLMDPEFASFSPVMLREKKSERVQIAFRLADRLSLKRVYAIDETGGTSEPDYFPFDKVASWASANGRQVEIDRLIAAAKAESKKVEQWQSAHSIGGVLRRMNEPARVVADHGVYYSLLGLGNTRQQPGSDLNAMWYLRNAKIFAKLMTVAKPGDRILIVYGAGHGYWLRHFATTTPGYRNVEVTPLLAGQR